MKVGGRYLCVSLAQDHVLKCLMDNFKEGWLVRVHVVAIEISEEAGLGGELPVFVFVMTKMATIPGKPAVKVSECGTVCGVCGVYMVYSWLALWGLVLYSGFKYVLITG